MIAVQKILHTKMRWMLPAGFLFVLFSTLLLCTRQPETAIEGFRGVWKTSEPRYKDRFFEITASTITFGTADGDLKIFVIDRLRKTVEGKKAVYTILYNDVEGSDLKLVFYYSPDNGGVIRFKNRQEVQWTRINHNGRKAQSQKN